MNIARVVVLGIAGVAAFGAVLVVRTEMKPKAPAVAVAAPVTTSEDVLVAARDVPPGQYLDAPSVRWQTWPKAGLAASFITKSKQPDIAKAIDGMIVRAPLVSGQPVTDSNTVRANTPGFLAATLGSGMRAISVAVSDRTGAGGFILPNDRVDVLLTRDMGGNNGKNFETKTLLRDVRALAIDQIIQQDKDKQAVVGHVATLELTPEQAELMAQAEQTGVISLALRRLGESNGTPLTVAAVIKPRIVVARPAGPPTPAIKVYKAGVLQTGPSGGGAGAGGGGGQGVGAEAIPAALGAAL